MSDVFGDVTSSESSLSFLTQTLMNLGDENGDDLISREEFYILQDFKNQQQKEKESMMEFREDLWRFTLAFTFIYMYCNMKYGY